MNSTACIAALNVQGVAIQRHSLLADNLTQIPEL
jgi:hypothetical protein